MKVRPRSLRSLLQLTMGMLFVSCPHQAAVPKNRIFNGSFGERFEYSPSIAIDYNPHGGATKASFIHDGVPIGTMIVAPRPPENVSKEVMRDVIVESTKSKYAATAVKHSKLTNRYGCVFDHYSSDAHHGGMSYRYELFLYIDKRKLSSPAQSLITESFGMHKFEFIIQDERYVVARPLIESIIDSFSPSWTSRPGK